MRYLQVDTITLQLKVLQWSEDGSFALAHDQAGVFNIVEEARRDNPVKAFE